MIIATNTPYTIVSSNIDVDTATVFVPNTGYAIGTIVQYLGYRYESLSNIPVNDPALSPTIWYPLGRVNQDKMFDAYTNTETISSGDIVLEIQSSDADTIALFGLYASSVKVEVVNNLTLETIYNKIEELEVFEIADWYEWTRDERIYKKDFYTQLPMFFDATITLTIKSRDSLVKCSHFAIGKSKNLGCTQWGATVSRRSNITKERSKDGHIYLSQGISWKRMSVPVRVPTNNIDVIENRLGEIDGIPTLFIGDDREDNLKSMLVFGFFREFDISIGIARGSYTLEIEGVG